MVDWSRVGHHDRYGNGLARAKYRGWLYALVMVVGALNVDALRDARRRSLARATLLVYVFGSSLHLVPWETPRGYVLALAADFCAIAFVRSGVRLLQPVS